jgi:hypothetical protein
MPATSGQSARGPWQRQEVVFDVKGQSQYPRKVCVTFFNKADEVARLAMGVEYVVSVDIESREYNGKWYTDVRAWRVQPKQVAVAPESAAMPDMPPFGEEPAYAAPQQPMAEVDDLPF